VLLETERLILREFEEADFEDVYRMYCDAEVRRYLAWEMPPKPEYLALYRQKLLDRHRFDKGLGVWAGIARETDEFIGVFMLKPLEEGPEIEVGYHLARWAWGRGFATEGARALVEYGFRTVELDRIVAVVDPENAASLAVVGRLGLAPAGSREAYGKPLSWFEATR
jgi:RimJ/RimL family protein N-acetyltransferase